jgi:hypothetical protein
MTRAAYAELAAACTAPYAQLGQDRQRDAGVVVLSWPAVPVEIVRAAGFSPVLAHASAAPTPAADQHLEPGVFPLRIHQLIEAAVTGRLAGVAAVVVPKASDPDYKCFLYLRELARRGVGGPYPPVLLLDLLQSDGRAVDAYDEARMGELFAQLCALPGARHVADGLAAEVASSNVARAAGRRLQALRRDAHALRGVDAMRMLGAFWQLPAARYVELADAAAEATVPRDARPVMRVLLAGAPVSSPALHAAIEAHHAIVVDEISPWGSDAVRADVATTTAPLRALAQHYRAMPAPRLPVHSMLRRFDAALPGIDSVIVSLPPDDATFGWDYPRMRDRLTRLGIPHTAVHADAEPGLPPAELQKIAALVDTLGTGRQLRHG